MLDGKEEIGEDYTFGIKTLRDTTFFKASSKVDYVNWWKEFSTFISAPLKSMYLIISCLFFFKKNGSILLMY